MIASKAPMNPILSLFTACLLATSATAGEGGFLFATFKGEGTPMTEQIHFGLSRDGLHWEGLNNAEPVLVSKLGEKGVRDPFIFRSHDGKKTYIIATDLSIHLNRDWGRAQERGSKSIVVWESEDLVHWSKPDLVKVAPPDAGCTWAPEAVYDEIAKDYLVFWASKTRSDKFAKQRIWAAKTKDFKTFGKPFIYIEQPNHIIDTDIVWENGTYYRFSKDETVKAITMENSKKLNGPWVPISGFSLAGVQGYEGPACFPITPGKDGQPGTWCLLIDYYSKGKGYQPYITKNLAEGKFEQVTDFKFPFLFRHGGVLRVTEEEYKRLQETYAKPAKAD